MSVTPSLRERALRFLAQREHSRAELARKLAPHAESDEQLSQLLDSLAERRLLSDERYADSRSHLLARKYGSSRIFQDLKAHGVDADLARETAAGARAGDLERARDIWRRKFRTAPTSRQERARHMRFLQSRGFSFEVIRAVLQDDLGELGDIDSDVSDEQ